jgi:hypothetical protein
MNNLFCIEILNEKPVISFDELLYIKSEIDKIQIDENTKEHI